MTGRRDNRGQGSLWRRVGHEAALLEREIPRTNFHAGMDGRTRRDTTAEFLRDAARATLREIVTDPASHSEDPFRTRSG